MTHAMILPPTKLRVPTPKTVVSREMICERILPPACTSLLANGVPVAYIRDLYGLDKNSIEALLLDALADQTRDEGQLRALLNHVRRCMWAESENLAVMLGYEHSNNGTEPIGRHEVARALGSVVLVGYGKPLALEQWEEAVRVKGKAPYPGSDATPVDAYADLMVLIDFVAKWLRVDNLNAQVGTHLIARSTRAMFNLLDAAAVT